jgi:type 1 fimbria pilin
MKKLAVLLVVLLVTAAAAAPVSAGKPVVETGDYDVSNPIDPSPCEFGIEDHVLGAWRSTSFYDNQGKLLKIITVTVGTDNLQRIGDPTIVLTGHFTSVDTYDALTDAWTAAGTFFSINLPDYGKVLKVAGRVDFATGRFVGVDTASPEAWALLCEALAGD